MAATRALAATHTPNQRRATKMGRAFSEPRTPGQTATSFDDRGRPATVARVLTTGPGPDEREWRAEILRHTGLSVPGDREVVLDEVRTWGEKDEPYVYVRYRIRDRDHAPTTLDLEPWTRIIRRAPRTRMTAVRDRTRVVALGDLQIGKVDHRGGSEELLARVDAVLAELVRVMRAEPCDDLVLLDAGDLLESFQNTSSQAFTNDLSFPDQQRLARHIVTHIVLTLSAEVRRTTVLSVPSNHSAWRAGKGALGNPGDDFGLDVYYAVSEAFALAKRGDVEFVFPTTTHDVAVAIRVRGEVIGLAHGHTAGGGANSLPTWLTKQFAGDGALAGASLVVTGHFHHLRMESVGRVSLDGRARDRMWMQVPAMDNGSSWWANGGGGHDSDPGLLTFTVGDGGWAGDLRLVRPQTERLAAAS